ncbi:ParA family protein [Kitasatospora aburaviensis]
MVLDAPEVLPAAFLPYGPAVIANYFQKGGTGKTEVTRAMIEQAAKYGLPVVGIDLDPHANLTAGLGIDLVADEANLANLLTGRWRGSIKELLVKRSDNLFIVPSNIDMPLVEQDLQSVKFREERLRTAIQPLLDEGFLVVLDCPNNPGLLNDNALIAVSKEKGALDDVRRGLVMVVQLEGSSVHSLELLLDQVDSLNDNTRYEARLLGWVANLVEGNTRIAKKTRDSLGELPLHALGEIPKRTHAKDAWDAGQFVGEYDPKSDLLPLHRQICWNILRTLRA